MKEESDFPFNFYPLMGVLLLLCGVVCLVAGIHKAGYFVFLMGLGALVNSPKESFVYALPKSAFAVDHKVAVNVYRGLYVLCLLAWLYYVFLHGQ